MAHVRQDSSDRCCDWSARCTLLSSHLCIDDNYFFERKGFNLSVIFIPKFTRYCLSSNKTLGTVSLCRTNENRPIFLLFFLFCKETYYIKMHILMPIKCMYAICLSLLKVYWSIGWDLLGIIIMLLNISCFYVLFLRCANRKYSEFLATLTHITFLRYC